MEYQKDKNAFCVGLNDYEKAKEIVEFESIENQQFQDRMKQDTST